MTHVERAYREAMEKGGWRPNGITLSENNISWWIKANGERKDCLLDPLFWQALGKARGWRTWKGSGLMPYIHDWLWHKNWHRLIDHLAEGKDAESFFAELK